MASDFRASSLGAGGDVPSLTASAIVVPAVSWSHILRIDGYSRTKGRLGNGKFIASEKFTVGGHGWCLRYYPGGHLPQEANSIIFFLSLDGANADEVKAKFTISLLDQDGNPVPSYSNTSELCAFSHGRETAGYELIKRVDLERCVYLRDDVFSVRCDFTVAKEIFTEAIPVRTVYPGQELLDAEFLKLKDAAKRMVAHVQDRRRRRREGAVAVPAGSLDLAHLSDG